MRCSTRVDADPSAVSGQSSPPYSAVTRRPSAKSGWKVAVALAGLFDGLTPEEFSDEVRDFLGRAGTQRSAARCVGDIYQPMLELLDELRRRDFTIGIVTGGGTEFVRAISTTSTAYRPRLVVGTLSATS